MKTIVVIGLIVIAVVPGVWILSSDAPLPNEISASAEPDCISRAAASHNGGVSSTSQRREQKDSIPEDMLALIEAETDRERRSEMLDRVLGSVADADLPDKLISLLSADGPAAGEFRKLLVRRWAENAPAAAAEWASQLPEGPKYLQLLRQVAIAWANNDLSSASAWAEGLPEGSNKLAATMAVAYEAARTNPVAALELAKVLPVSRARDDLLVHSVSQWAVGDSVGACAWTMNVEDQSLRDRLIAAVAIASAERDGSAAATLAASGFSKRDEQERTAISVVQRWAQHSPESVASWVSQFPNSPLREVATQNLLTVWTARDPEAVETWLRELPAGSLRDESVDAYTQALGNRAGMLISQGLGRAASEAPGIVL